MTTMNLTGNRGARALRTIFLLGALLDAVAAVVMLYPPAGELVWGLDAAGAPYGFAMGYGGALMLGWTALLLWAAREPVARRDVALLTAFPVVTGLALTEVLALAAGAVDPARVLPLVAAQAVMVAVLVAGYRHATPSRAAA